MFLFHLIQENRESLEQFFAEYGEAGKKVFEEDPDDDEDKETVEEDTVDTIEEEKYVKEILQGSDSVKQGDKLKSKVQSDLKEILQVTDKERSQVADILRVLKESKGGKEKEQMGVMFLVQSAVKEKNLEAGEWLYNKSGNMKKYVSGTDYEMIPHVEWNFSPDCCILHTARYAADVPRYPSCYS